MIGDTHNGPKKALRAPGTQDRYNSYCRSMDTHRTAAEAKYAYDALSKHVDDEDRSDVAIYDGSQNRNMTVINESGLYSLDDDEKAKFNLGLRGGDTGCVNEPGLYSLVLGSRKPEAKAFKRCITHEVIPTIRKHGLNIDFFELLMEQQETM